MLNRILLLIPCSDKWVRLSMGKSTKVTTIEQLTFHGCSSCIVYIALILYWVKYKVCDPIVGTSNFTYNISIGSNWEFLHPLSNIKSQRLSSQVFISNRDAKLRRGQREDWEIIIVIFLPVKFLTCIHMDYKSQQVLGVDFSYHLRTNVSVIKGNI